MSFYNNSYQYFVAIGLPEKEDKLFSYLKEQFHPNGNMSSPSHITLIPPFRHDKENALIFKLTDWAKGQRPFCVEFEEVNNFVQKKYGTVYLGPNDGELIKQMYINLVKEFPYLPHRGDFVPHLTIANRTPLDKVDEYKSKLIKMQIKLDLKVKSVVLYRRLPGERWSVFEEFKFEK